VYGVHSRSFERENNFITRLPRIHLAYEGAPKNVVEPSEDIPMQPLPISVMLKKPEMTHAFAKPDAKAMFLILYVYKPLYLMPSLL
jgi:hypothetical protein